MGASVGNDGPLVGENDGAVVGLLGASVCPSREGGRWWGGERERCEGEIVKLKSFTLGYYDR